MNTEKFKFGIANIFLYIALSQILTFILGKTILFENKIYLNLHFLIAPILAGITIILLNREKCKHIFKNFKKNYKKYIPLILKYYFCGLLIMSFSTRIIAEFTQAIPENEEANRLLFKSLPIYSAITTIITAPICEELIFRASFKEAFKKKEVFLITTSLLFGLSHTIFTLDFINTIPYAALGFFLGMIYYETDNILCSILTHAMHNSLCILLLLAGGIL